MSPESKQVDCTPNHFDELRALKEDTDPTKIAQERSMLKAAQDNMGMFKLAFKDRGQKVAMAQQA